MSQSFYSNSVLLVIQQRQINETLDLIGGLPIDKYWLRAIGDNRLGAYINPFVQKTRYRNYLIVTDDVLVSLKAMHTVCELLKKEALATGHCRLKDGYPLVNLTAKVLQYANGKFPVWDDYGYVPAENVKRMRRSWYAGFALTGLRREIMTRFPFCVNEFLGNQPDAELCRRTSKAGLTYLVHTDAYMGTVKDDVERPLLKNWIVGLEQESAVFEKA